MGIRDTPPGIWLILAALCVFVLIRFLFLRPGPSAASAIGLLVIAYALLVIAGAFTRGSK
ncbi:MAG TPA: hypothetical protein VM243_09310 [Phycisphaerae bacterium]|nr:hypothetical protein [Phycisphaerae bacterium]